MDLVRRKYPRDYSSLFLAIVLIGLVAMVVGLMMASARSTAVRTRPLAPALSERGPLPKIPVNLAVRMFPPEGTKPLRTAWSAQPTGYRLRMTS
jgi:hypothetical protein